jgi:hydrogenase maturation factor
MARRSLASGKIPVELLTDLLADLPPAPPEVRLGPAVGEDACAVEIPGGILVAASDPITLTGENIGRWSVVVNANDVAVTGTRPRWFLAVVLVPPQTTEPAVRELFADIRRSLLSVGAHLVGGHTEVTPAVTQPVVVGQMLGLAEDGAFVASHGAVVGDIVLEVGPAPIEGTAVLAREAADRLEELSPAVVEAARAALDRPGISVVEPALLAARLGATALHDPTEGGLAGGLHELARASNVGIRVDRGAMLWFEPGLAVCRALGADPWSTLASGTLLAVFPPEIAVAACAAIAEDGYAVAVIGIVESGTGVYDTDGRTIPWPDRDEVNRLLPEFPRLSSGNTRPNPTPRSRNGESTPLADEQRQQLDTRGDS